MAAMVFRDADPPCCHACLRRLPREESDETLRCQGCRIERYCSSTCMNTARLTHHSPAGECAAFEAAMDAECSGGLAFAFDDLPNRFLVRVVSQAGGWRVPGEPAQRGALIHRFLTLEASVPEEGTVERRLLASIARNTLRLMDESVNEGVKTVDPDASAEGTSLRLGESELTRVMCCVHRNSHALYAHVGSDGAEAGSVGVESRPVGAAVYLEGSAFNHSCRPGATFGEGGGTELRVVSSRRIVRGEEVTISYVPVSMEREERRKILRSKYGFTCDCDRCAEEEARDGKVRKEGQGDFFVRNSAN